VGGVIPLKKTRTEKAGGEFVFISGRVLCFEACERGGGDCCRALLEKKLRTRGKATPSRRGSHSEGREEPEEEKKEEFRLNDQQEKKSGDSAEDGNEFSVYRSG